jgi:hypothetical protein
MQKFIISVKEKSTGRDVIPPYVVNSLDGFGNYSERVSSLGLIVIVDVYRGYRHGRSDRTCLCAPSR